MTGVDVEERPATPVRARRAPRAPSPPTPRPRRRRRRRGLRVVVVLVVVVLAWAAWLALDALRARAALESVAADLPALQTQVQQGQDASATLVAVQEEAATAARATHGPHWRIASALPVVGDDARAFADVAGAVDELAAQALPRLARAAEVAAPGRLVPTGGVVDLAPLQEARSDVLAADASVGSALETVEGIDTGSLVPQLASAVDELAGQLVEVRSATATAARAVDLLPPMLGADGPRDYLVLVQNNAEPRAAGGIAGSVLHLRAEGGAVELVEVRAGKDLGGYDESVLDLAGPEKALFGDDLGRFMVNATSTPDFPRTAQLARANWADRTGTQVDGVLAVDPVALQGLLEATGPVTFTDPAGAEVRITGDDAAAFLLDGVYRRYEEPAVQDVVLAGAADAVFRALTSLDDGSPARVVDALARSAREGRLLVWSADEREQGRLAGTVLSGELTGAETDASGESSPVVGVFLNASSAAKVGYYLDARVAVEDLTCRPDGSQAFTVAVTLTSILSPDDVAELPGYVLGQGGDGTIHTNLLVYAPRHGAIRGADSDGGADLGLFSQVHDGLVVGGRTVDLEPGAAQTYRYQVVSGKNQPGIVSVTKTPGARTTSDSVPASGCEQGVFS
ncbi:DUF4012 domain-containing protein [Cellulosimicrobium arenosum]|uniref:DUF4012 domain-containing protein n=1 Tax=Cellulosimicrobium arenosum TaxID=2708133 RepID=A0A927PEN8_9MICO|nr:DUF4012 domain-containing protein [Cellulosimicrobium arenosum]MBD8079759.1 DUF4012 domain-containing protein [Cellulosimicrobium arenosum]